jgi:hypothetical protein
MSLVYVELQRTKIYIKVCRTHFSVREHVLWRGVTAGAIGKAQFQWYNYKLYVLSENIIIFLELIIV